MSRFRDIKRQMRGDVHREASVPAFYIPAPNATPTPCTVRVWPKVEPQMVGALPLLQGAAEVAEPEDRLRFDLSEIPAPLTLRRGGVVSVEVGEAYRIDHLYPVDLGYQTARVTRLAAAEADGLPVPQ